MIVVMHLGLSECSFECLPCRERIAAARKKAGQADVEGGTSVPTEDLEIGLFSFWDTEASQLKAAAAVAADNPFQSVSSIDTHITAAQEAKLR